MHREVPGAGETSKGGREEGEPAPGRWQASGQQKHSSPFHQDPPTHSTEPAGIPMPQCHLQITGKRGGT